MLAVGRRVEPVALNCTVSTEQSDREVQAAAEKASFVRIPPAHQPRQQVPGAGHRRALRASREGHARASAHALL